MKMLAAMVSLALAAAACGGSGGSGGGAVDEPPSSASAVEIRMFSFTPPSITVKPGTTVTWTNQDEILHTATSGSGPDDADGLFDGAMEDAGTSFSFTFDQPGTYEYFCARHPGVPAMHGTVVVSE